MSEVHDYIILGTMYRDGDNYKSSDTIVYSNDAQVPDATILKRINPFIENEIDFVPAYYNMPSISPVDNEFTASNGPDHPFQTITDITFSDSDEKYIEAVHEDIADLLQCIDDPDTVEKGQAQAKAEAKIWLSARQAEIDGYTDTKIIITVEGGMVTAVGGNQGNVKIIILDYDKQADDPIVISEQLQPDYIFKEGEAWRNWDEENQSTSDTKVKRHLKKIKF